MINKEDQEFSVFMQRLRMKNHIRTVMGTAAMIAFPIAIIWQIFFTADMFEMSTFYGVLSILFFMPLAGIRAIIWAGMGGVAFLLTISFPVYVVKILLGRA